MPTPIKLWRKPIICNLLGGPGCGKSTTRAGVFSLLKVHGINAEEATEFAKDLAWEHRHTTLKNQYYIWGNQYHRQFRLGNVDVVITDSPLILSIVYARVYDINNPEFEMMVWRSFNEFNNINFFIERKNQYNSNGRSQKEEEAKKLDVIVRGMINEFGIPHIAVPGTYMGINEIAQIVLKDFFGVPRLKVKFTEDFD